MTTRRGFLRSVSAAAAALMVPTVAVRQTIDAERLMAAFCDPDSCRYELKTPFFQKGMTFATDSRAMVVADIGKPELGETRHLPNAAEIIEKGFNARARWVPLSELDLTPTIVSKYSPCPECGDRHVPCSKEHDHLLVDPFVAVQHRYDPDEHTIGDQSCHVCRGKHYHGPALVDVLGVKHCAWNLKRIAAIPDVKVSVCDSDWFAEMHANERSICLQFQNEQFRGLSMGVVPQ